MVEKVLDIPIYRLEINPQDENTGIYATGLVETPAIGINWVKFNENTETIFKFQNEYEQILTGPFLVPDQLLYRNDTVKGAYYCTIDAETIKLCSQKFLKNGFTTATTHQHLFPLDSNYITESWIITSDTQDKAIALGYQLPIGTWMISVKVEDTKYWNEEILTGNVKGFSIEGIFSEKLILHDMQYPQDRKRKKRMKKTSISELLKWVSTGKKFLAEETIAEVEATEDAVELAMVEYTTVDGQTVQLDELTMSIDVQDSDGNVIGSLHFVPLEVPALETPEETQAPVTPAEMPTTMAEQTPSAEVEALKVEFSTQLENTTKMIESLVKEIESLKNSKVAPVTLKKQDDLIVSKLKDGSKPSITDLLNYSK